MTASNTLALSSQNTLTQYRNGVMDMPIFEEVSAFLQRTTGWSIECAKGLCIWVDELIVCRDAHGAVCAADGFKFVDLRSSGAPYCLILKAFSAGDGRAGDRDAHLLRIAAHVCARERLFVHHAALVWVTSTSEEPKFVIANQERAMHRAPLSSSSPLRQSTWVYTDHPEAMSPDGQVPPNVEVEIFKTFAMQHQVVLSAERGETLLLPCLPESA